MEIEQLIGSNIQMAAMLLKESKDLCQLFNSSISLQNTTFLNQTATGLKESSENFILHLSSQMKDVQEVMIEFAEFTIAMAQEVDITLFYSLDYYYMFTVP